MITLKILFKDIFTDRELGLLYDCMKYASIRPDVVQGPAGLPAHNLILVIVKLFRILMKVSLGLTEDRARTILGEGIETKNLEMNSINRCFVILCDKDKE